MRPSWPLSCRHPQFAIQAPQPTQPLSEPLWKARLPPSLHLLAGQLLLLASIFAFLAVSSGCSTTPALEPLIVPPAAGLQALQALFKGQLMGVGVMAVMHLYFKYTNPLLIQSIIPLKGAFEGNLVKIHLLGYPASGDLKRPWKQAQGFMGAMQGGEIKTDKKSIEQAERAGRGGAKEE